MTEFRPEEKDVVYIGEGVSLTGSVQADDIVVVDGNVDGEVTCSQLIVGPSGVVTGIISVSEADVYGKIGTDISVKQLLIVRSSGRVEGKWVYGEIEVEKGGVLAGMAEATEFRAEPEQEPLAKQEPAARQGYKRPELVAEIEEQEASSLERGRVASLASRALRDRKRSA
jgi:cytoskeletal protein CcmA (bactofilin family)